MPDLISGNYQRDENGNLIHNNTPAILGHWRNNVRLPKGRYYYDTSLFSQGESSKLKGFGMASQLRGDAAFDVTDPANVTALIWAGPNTPEARMVRINHGCTHMEDIYFCMTPLTNYNGQLRPVEPSLGTIIEVTNVGNSQAVGNCTYERVLLGSAARGWFMAPSTHCDHQSIRDCITTRVRVPFTANENQSVEHIIDGLTCHPNGYGDCVFDAIQGGRITCYCVKPLDTWTSLIKTPIVGPREAAYHYGLYDIYVVMDNTTFFKHCIQERDDDEKAACWVRVRGMAADDTEMGPPLRLNAGSKFDVHVVRVRKPDFVYN